MRSDREKLISEFPDLTDGNLILGKEVFAHFGLLFYQFALVEHSLLNVATFSLLIKNALTTERISKSEYQSSFDECEKIAKSKTFGNLINIILNEPEFEDYKKSLFFVKNKRNYFAHHFLRDEAEYLCYDEGCWFLMEQMQKVRHRTQEIEQEIKVPFEKMCIRYGITSPNEEWMKEYLDNIIFESREKVAAGSAVIGWNDNAL